MSRVRFSIALKLLIVDLCIYASFTAAVCSSDYVVSKDKINIYNTLEKMWNEPVVA